MKFVKKPTLQTWAKKLKKWKIKNKINDSINKIVRKYKN